MRQFFLFFFTSILCLSCSTEAPLYLSDLLTDSQSIQGKEAYLDSPFVTAGDRVYMVGHQNGTFPSLGWHIKGEMGGIWNHPIKLMDGFDAKVIIGGDTLSLNQASSFVNYPFANKHIFEFPSKNLVVERYQFVPDGQQGVFVQYVIKNDSNENMSGSFQFFGHTDLRPTWLGEHTQMYDDVDEARYEEGKWIVKDKSNPWFNIYGSDRTPSDNGKLPRKKGENHLSGELVYNISLAAKSRHNLNFTVAGSYTSLDDAKKNYETIQNEFYDLGQQKKARYNKLSEQTKLTIPNADLQQTFEWLKYNCDWLVRTVPEIGTGIGAGIPDYPWWFGVDSEYSLKGYMAIGQNEIVEKTIKLLDSVSMDVNGNGKILHEMSTNGSVFNKGNINETPQFTSLIWEIYLWNGDKQFLEKYFPTVQKGLDWLLKENDENKNLFPDGFGMMEIHGLDSEMIDVAAYTQRAFDDASKMAAELNLPEASKSYKILADTLKKKINEEFWSEDFDSYADFLGTDEQALHLIEDAIVRADTLNKPWAIEELKTTKEKIIRNPSHGALKPFVLHHNWVVNTPMEMGIADSAKAITALDTAKKFTNPFGVFVTGIDRDDSAGKDLGSFKGSKVFSYTGAVMTLPTGVQAIAENNYGRPNEALDYLNRMTRTFSYALPGSMYEVSPDYGMMAQAWNIYSYAIPIVQQFFGIMPLAHKKIVVIEPQMPDAWDRAQLENVKISDNAVSILYHKDGNNLKIEVNQSNPDWTIQLILPKNNYSIVTGNSEHSTEGNSSIFTSSDKQLLISLNQ
ncbi:glycogen debranching protein [Muricauda sp. JGD-17]|uniref:Glycogen debranching protein n=1 Tax=Flagellimonas ochracea TaxID=2696472 RepID=A0A964WXM3_9FLAO|nr:glycogen debranching protein [Allomuricauda ochracea]NAY91958.1 glycogen debranching protein [Allomuricauda ochracea]